MESESRHLLDRITEGDQDAIPLLLERYLPDLRRYIQRRLDGVLRKRESKEDLVQSCCRELLERVADGRFRFQGEAQFRQWLYQAALLKLRDRQRHWRAGKRDAGREAALGAGSQRWSAALFPASGDSPVSQVVRQEQLDLLDQAFQQLPERDREILGLAHVEGLSHREIAEKLGVTPEHSRVLLSRAVARLARLVDDHQGKAGDA